MAVVASYALLLKGQRMTIGEEEAHVPEHILVEANELVDWIRFATESLPLPPTPRAMAAAACFVVAQEHHSAIVLLSEHQLFASGFALIRVAFDAYVRGVWLSVSATDTEVERFISLKEPPNTGLLVLAIEAHPDFEDGFLSSYKKQSYKWLCDFTHTGGRQIQRWTAPERVEPNYPIGEVLEVIATSESIALLGLVGIIALVEDYEIALEAIRKFGIARDHVLTLHTERRATFPYC